jgi:hypothetical protein
MRNHEALNPLSIKMPFGKSELLIKLQVLPMPPFDKHNFQCYTEKRKDKLLQGGMKR